MRRTAAVIALVASLLVGVVASSPPAAALGPGVPADRFATDGDFVQYAYERVLGRQPDPGGLVAFRAALGRGATDAAGVLDALASSAEWESYAGATIRLYRTAFARRPDPNGLRGWLAQRGRLPFGAVADAFAASGEFSTLYGSTDDPEYVRRLYRNALGREPDAAGLAGWVARLRQGESRSSVAVAVSESTEHRARRATEVAVTGAYAGLLDRTPDTTGDAGWQRFLAGGGPRRAMLGAIFASGESRGRQPAVPGLAVSDVVGGLSIPWGLSFAPDGTLFLTERAGGITARLPDGTVRGLDLRGGLDDRVAAGEGGLLDVAVDPGFSSNRRLVTCHTRRAGGGGLEVVVVRWVVDPATTSASRQATLVDGIPGGSGRHNGCRLLFPPAEPGVLYVGTGDAAVGTTPQSLTSLGGKVLRLDAETGQGAPGNPFASSSDARTRRIFNLGHRNIQGLAVQPDTGRLFSVEHGTARDDEVNVVVPGNFGWDPRPGYDESTPMTRPGAIGAVWRSGAPTVAPSGATFLAGCAWGAYRDHLVLATLAGTSLRMLGISDDGQHLGDTVLPALRGTRLRTAVQGPDGALYVATSLGGGRDRIVRIAPTGVAC